MYCKYCGESVDSNCVVCPKCGKQLQVLKSDKPEDVASTGVNILSFFFPIVGLIIYLANSNSRPNYAKGAGLSALIGWVIGWLVLILGSCGTIFL